MDHQEQRVVLVAAHLRHLIPEVTEALDIAVQGTAVKVVMRDILEPLTMTRCVIAATTATEADLAAAPAAGSILILAPGTDRVVLRGQGVTVMAVRLKQTDQRVLMVL